MRYLVYTVAALLCSTGVQAQPWMEQQGGPRKLQDIIASQESSLKTGEEEEEEEEFVEKGKARKEGRNYHFSRWTWHWEQHLDEQGYLVSPAKNLREWAKYRTGKSGARFKTTNNQSQWTFQGPDQSPGGYKGIGRINVVAFHPTDLYTYIIGSAGGGAWRTVDDGIHWTSLYDDLPVLGVSDVDYNPLNANTIYLCTGDRDAGDTYSVGVLKSYDGGAHWDTTGLQFIVSDFQLTNALVINPLDTNSLALATNNGIYRSFDGGATWAGVNTGHYKEIVYAPGDTNVLFAASYSGQGANILRSADGGMTWAAVTNFSDTRRISLAVTPADPLMVKAVVANNDYALKGIYQSTDQGQTFQKIFGDENDCSTNILSGSLELDGGTCSGQAWYDLCMAINPANPFQVLVGGVNTYQSLDGGSTWEIVTQWYGGLPGIREVHADKHYLAFHPLDPGSLFECNDGGIYKTLNPASMAWTDLSNGLGITQFYRNAVSNVADYVIGGSQDNGTKRIRFNGTFNELTGGDGMDCQMDYSDPSVFYTSSQYGHLSRTTDDGASYDNISDNIPGNPEGAWITPFIIYHGDPNMLIAGYDHVWMSPDQGNTWFDISPNFTSPNKIQRVAMTPADPNRIFILNGNNYIQYTDDFGANWITVPSTPAGSLSNICPDPWDKDHFWVTYGGYTTNRVAEYRFGQGWTVRNDSLPFVPVHCMVIDSSNGTIYLGTDVAIFYRDTSMSSWQLYNNGLPVIEVPDLAINYTTNEVWAATYGRGMWKSPRHETQAPVNAINNIPYARDVITIAPNPNQGQFVIRTDNSALKGKAVSVSIMGYTGARAFQTEASFNGEGRLPVQAPGLARGSYIVEVMKEGRLFARAKMVVM